MAFFFFILFFSFKAFGYGHFKQFSFKRGIDWRSAAGDTGDIARNGDVSFFGFFSSMLLGARVRSLSLEKHGLEVRCG